MSASDFWILSYGCTSAAGLSTAELWRTLRSGLVPDVMQWTPPKNQISSRETLAHHLALAWRETFDGLSATTQRRLRDGSSVGIILASTKGCIDDVIWSAAPALERDTLSPLLDDFLLHADLQPRRRTSVSNACTSGLSALYLARHWLKHGGLSDVIIIAADRASEFVQKGFAALKVLTPDQTRPFSGARSGFKIGDAATCVVLSNHRDESDLNLAGVAIDGEGHAVTRPSQSGESLEAACRQLPLQDDAPDLVIAHGTSTSINDATEDRVYSRLFINNSPLITASKWATGHTLGASGTLDLVAACEVLKHGSAFAIATTEESDPSFKNRYAVRGSQVSGSFRRVMISSLGFGGIHAAALVETRR